MLRSRATRQDVNAASDHPPKRPASLQYQLVLRHSFGEPHARASRARAPKTRTLTWLDSPHFEYNNPAAYAARLAQILWRRQREHRASRFGRGQEFWPRVRFDFREEGTGTGPEETGQSQDPKSQEEI